jgi:hypothetical protein
MYYFVIKYYFDNSLTNAGHNFDIKLSVDHLTPKISWQKKAQKA